MRRIERAGSAGRAAGCADPDLIQHHEDGFRFHLVKRDVRSIRKTWFQSAVADSVWDAAEDARFQPVSKRAHPGVLVLKRGHSQFSGAAEAYHIRDVFGAAAAPFFLAPTNDVWSEFRVSFYVKNPDAFGRMKFMRGQREKINAGGPDVELDLARSLHRIGMKRDAFVTADSGDLLNR